VVVFGEAIVRGPANYPVRDTCLDKMSVLVPGGTSTFREFSKRRNEIQSYGPSIVRPHINLEPPNSR
jgi:hypothetical protein